MRFIITLAILLVHSRCRAEETDFLEAAIAGWQTIESNVQTVNLNYERRKTPIDSRSRDRGVTFAAWQGEYVKSESKSDVTIQNQAGLYRLTREEGGKWQVVSSTPINALAEGERLDRLTLINGAAIYILGGTLLEFAESDDFQFGEWSEDPNGLVSCKIVNESKSPTKRFETANIVLDSKHNYRLVSLSSSRTLSSKQATEDWDFVYETSDFLPSVVSQKFVREDLVIRTDELYSDISHNPLPIEEFSLSKYGLNDPSSRSRSGLLWLFAGFFLILSVVFVVRYLRR